MWYPALTRVKRLSLGQSTARIVPLLGAGAALLIPLLVLVFALIVQLVVSPASQQLPTDLVLGPWVHGSVVPLPFFNEWPFFDNREFTLILLVLVGAMLAALQCGSFVLLQRMVRRQASRVSSELREAIHRQTIALGPDELLGVVRSRPEQLFTDATNTVRHGLAKSWHIVPRSLVTLGCVGLLAFVVNFWLTLLATLLAVGTVRWYQRMQRNARTHEQHWEGKANDEWATLLRSLNLARLRVGYGLAEPRAERFASELQPLEAAELRRDTARALISPLLMLSSLLAAAFLLFVVGLSAQFTIAGTAFIAAALLSAFFEAKQLLDLRPLLQSAETAAADIFAFLDRVPSVHESTDATKLEPLGASVSLESVTLVDRDGTRLLDEVTIELPARGLLAVLASDSQTPLALGGLLVRFYDPDAGRVLFDGQDIRHAVLDTVRGQALLVPHEGLVFPGSVSNNIMCGNNGFTALEVTDALKRARLFDFTQSLPEREATQLAAFDERVPSAQAFRLGLARALVREPSLLVVDEPSGDWPEDVAREHNEAIREATRNATVVVAPAQLDTLRAVDAVYLFHHGKLHDQGTHAELLQRSELYRHIIYLRFNPFRGEVE